MRNFTPRSVLLKYYNYNIQPIIQYGLLVYGCTSINALNPIHMLQKKIMRLIFYIKKYDSITDHFYSSGILTVHELYVHELLKFCLQSVNEMHSTVFLNSFFTKTEYMRKTRKSEFLLFSEPFCKKNTRSN